MNDKSKYELQLLFFQKLKSGLPAHLSLVNELSEILQISSDGAYRRLRGETALTMDELFKVCAFFKVSPEMMVGNDSTQVTFSFTPLSVSEKQFDRYFKGLYEQLKMISSAKDHHLYFTAEETPIFHFFNYPALTAFKIYYWNKCILNSQEYADRKFEPATVDPELVALGKKIFEEYNKVTCTEIWSEKTIAGVLKQFEYVLETSNFVRREDAEQVLAEIEQMVAHLRKATELGYKFDPNQPSHQPCAPYTFYQLDIMMGNITVYVKLGELRQVFLAFHSFNTLATAHPLFSQETENWLNNMLKRATLISGTAEKQREKFFGAIAKEIQKTRDKMVLFSA